MRKALFYLFIFAIVQVFSGIFMAVLKLILDIQTHDAEFVYFIIADGAASVLTLALFLQRKWCVEPIEYVKSKPYGTLGMVVLCAMAALIPSSYVMELLPENMTTNNLSELFSDMMGSPYGFVIITLLAPIVEEVVFRGAILRELLPKYGNRAIVISAIFFSLIHLNPAQIPHAFVVGILLGWIYSRTGSIVPGIVYHWVNNTAAFLLAVANPHLSVDAKLIEYFHGNYMELYVSLILSVILLVYSIMRLDKIMKRVEPEVKMCE